MNSLVFGKKPFTVDLRIPSTHLYGGPQYGANQTPLFIEWERKTLFSVRSVRVVMRRKLWTF